MVRFLRSAQVLMGVICLVVAFGFFLQIPLFTRIWPLPSGRLSNIFVASILAAIGVPVIWIGLTGELRAMAGGAINLLVTYAGFAGSMFLFYSRSHQAPLLVFGIGSLVMALVTGALFFYSLRFHFIERSRTPGLVRAAFAVFAVVLLLVSIALLLRRPNTFPWALSAENSVMYGWIFLGAMTYFIYALLIPLWGNARGQLLGFLAYDVILIGPFLSHFQDVPPQMFTSLVLYVIVLVFSGLLAVFYLFIHPATRFNYRRRGKTPLAAAS